MCQGTITDVWFQKEPLIAFKLQEGHDWSELLKPKGKWLHAIPQLITPGGGPSWTINNYFRDKGIFKFLTSPKGSGLITLEGVHLAGFHAYSTIKQAIENSQTSTYYCANKPIWKVFLGGIMQRSTYGELVASEMQVVKLLKKGDK